VARITGSAPLQVLVLQPGSSRLQAQASPEPLPEMASAPLEAVWTTYHRTNVTMSTRSDPIQAAQIVLPCAELGPTLAFFTERLGFRVDAISPADDPRVAVISGHGLRIQLEPGSAAGPGVVRLVCRDPASVAGGATAFTAPNGTRIELVDAGAPLALPPAQPSFVLNRLRDNAAWKMGRAGMRYRDLLPGRQGGRFIASHIHIPDAGPVPDYVHFHEVRWQIIYCHKGWARLVYEDQGPPFVLEAGDCVLQPPRIRHRVLECSAGLEVIELGSPAEHATLADHELQLPTSTLRPERDFGGQRFVRHRARAASWQPWRVEGYEERDTGIGPATGGLVGARVVRPMRSARPAIPATAAEACRHDGELLFLCVLQGSVAIQCDRPGAEPLEAGDSVTVPAGMGHTLRAASADLELLEVKCPDVAPPAR
jgi:mannose-6-phosphate isomerase-like protein (cupin superfamily)